MELNKVQRAAYELIQSDARFLYTITNIWKNAKNIESNYLMMYQPYLGVFVDGARQWCDKVGLSAPHLNEVEIKYYSVLRNGHKFLEKSYDEVSELLVKELIKSDRHFYKIRSLREIIFGYDNVGADICNNKYCGNTLLCAMYNPINVIENEEAGPLIKKLSIIAGKIAAFFGCKCFPPYKYNENIIVSYKDYHFFNKCPLNLKNELGVVLFCLLCSINYVIIFIEDYFIENIPQKFKFAYLQYYYLYSFIQEINRKWKTNLFLDSTLYNRRFRNCLAHYGLGQLLVEKDVVSDDILKGLTNKAFNMEYHLVKKILYGYLKDLTNQIEKYIF